LIILILLSTTRQKYSIIKNRLPGLPIHMYIRKTVLGHHTLTDTSSNLDTEYNRNLNV